MASSMRLDSRWLQSQLGDSAVLPELTMSTAFVGLAAVVLIPVLLSSLLGNRKPSHPVANPTGLFTTASQAAAEFVRNGNSIVREARARFGAKPYIVNTNNGPVTVLPPSVNEDIRNNRDLNFRKRVISDVYHYLPGLGSLATLDHPEVLMQNVIKKHLTKRLNTITPDLAAEAIFAIDKALGRNVNEWTEVKLYEQMLDMVARLSSRIFLGDEICRNEEWLDITKTYTIHVSTISAQLSKYPVWLVPFVYLFSSSGRSIRDTVRRAGKIIGPMFERRRQEKAECLAKGVQPPSHNDLIEWIEIESNGKPYNMVDFQLSMSFVAIHTTSDLLCQTMVQLAKAPENFEPLRKELADILSVDGWKKTSLYNMKLMDSTIKEAQRLKPVQELTLIRLAMNDVTLSDGTTIKKGEKTVVNVNNMNPELYPEPEKFDMHRFMRMRDAPGGEHKAQLVSTTAENVSFGFGIHACPGRFFAANEIKILLANLVLKYDWKLAPGTTTDPVYIAADPFVNPNMRLLYKRRTEEIDLDSLAAVAEE